MRSLFIVNGINPSLKAFRYSLQRIFKLNCTQNTTCSGSVNGK